MQSAARTYFQTQVTTTTQGDLLIMLFDGALRFLSQAREKILEKDYAKKGILISKALDILAELQATLNPQKGGDLVERLKTLYLYCSTRLLMANRKMDTAPLDETVRILTGVRDAFAEANSRVVTKPVAAMPTQATRVVGTGTDGTRLPVTGPAGPGYAVTAAPAGPATAPVAAVAVAAAMPEESAAPEDDTSMADGQKVPPASQSLVLQAVGSAQAGGRPRPAAPVRRIMAAYSSRSGG